MKTIEERNKLFGFDAPCPNDEPKLLLKKKIIEGSNYSLELESDSFDGRLLDTTVKIIPCSSDGVLLTISGNDILNFVEEFQQLIAKYEI